LCWENGTLLAICYDALLPKSANRKHISSVSKILVVERDVFALHIALIL
jgi:hypothetical protein